jgi:medium-chain acyl-[acyl-carrier-protein] hydrolase
MICDINVFSFPFAGGSQYSYNAYREFAPVGLNFIPFEYSGHGKRYNEKLYRSLDDVLADAFENIHTKLDQPYAFYGHSMGSLVAFLLARQISERQLPLPVCLFLTGCKAPSRRYRERFLYRLEKNEFINEVMAYGGFPKDLLVSAEMIDFFEPILRADFEATELFKYTKAEPLNIPISVMVGLQENCPIQDAMAWQEETIHKVDVRQFPGNHFFIFDFPEKIVQVIVNKLRQHISQPKLSHHG